MYADGRSEGVLSGASRFPRHWVYDKNGRLASKSGLIDFKDWYRKSFGKATPWGDQESEAFVTRRRVRARTLALAINSCTARPNLRSGR